MKKVLLSLGILVLLALCGVYWLSRVMGEAQQNRFGGIIHIKTAQNQPNAAEEKLKTALEKEGRKVILSYNAKHNSGDWFIYTAENVDNLPKVIDSNAINFLWIDKIEDNENPELLRPYDVIVTKSISAFSYLKSINVRTAFIPNAIDIKDNVNISTNGKAMFWGDGNIYSIALAHAGYHGMSLDVFGKNFAGRWPLNEVKADKPLPADFGAYSLVLVDQKDEDIRKAVTPSEIITIIENGGLPFIRYNPAVEKLFGEAVPMYHNSAEFKPKLEFLLAHSEELAERKEAIKNISHGWSSQGQAKKFIELFEIMEKKRR